MRGHKIAQPGPYFVEPRFELADEETHRLSLELSANLRLCFETRPRAGSERTVVQECDAWIERPVRREMGREAHGPRTTAVDGLSPLPSSIRAPESVGVMLPC